MQVRTGAARESTCSSLPRRFSMGVPRHHRIAAAKLRATSQFDHAAAPLRRRPGIVSFTQACAPTVAPMEQAIVSHRGSGARPPGALRSRAALRARASGITLIELLVTMTVVVILLSIGVPSFRYVTNANRIAGEVNGLLGDLQFARAEAVKEGQTVTVCRSLTGKSCQDLISWEKGWIVF